MEPTPPRQLSDSERERLRQTLARKYPDGSKVLGSQLGASVREQLGNPDLKRRLGGLKHFVTRYFPA